jgi:hypothetical protein
LKYVGEVGLRDFHCVVCALEFFFLVTMAFTVIKSRPKMIVSTDDIIDGRREVAFDGKILYWYGNWDPIKEDKKHSSLHCDLIDQT